MKNRLLIAFLFALSLAASGKTAQLQASSKPNILFILADNMGYADVGFNGGREIKTPNLRRDAGGDG